MLPETARVWSEARLYRASDPVVFDAIEVSTGRWVYRLGRRCVADFIALLDQVLPAFPGPR